MSNGVSIISKTLDGNGKPLMVVTERRNPLVEAEELARRHMLGALRAMLKLYPREAIEILREERKL